MTALRFIVADWGTTRFRAYWVEDETILDEVASDEGVSALREGEHRAVFLKHCGRWLREHPTAPILLVGMVGSREGWSMAPYAACPAGPPEIAAAMIPVEVEAGRIAHIVPGLLYEPVADAADVMRGEETLALGSGVIDGLVCSPGTHPKWIDMRGGRIQRFATFMTGEMYGLLLEHSMIGRPATDPEDDEGFDLGLDAAERNRGDKPAGLLNLLFGARAAVVSGKLPSNRLKPYLSGLLTGDELNGAIAMFPQARQVTILADPPRADLYRRALARRGIETRTKAPRAALLAGLGRLLHEGAAPRN